jgi:hypothetical protein
MGFFDNLFGGGNRRSVQGLLNPILEMKLLDFAVVEDDAVYAKHYFKFRNRESEDEEFIVIYRRLDPDLHYLRTQWRRTASGSEFLTLNERGPWSMAITYLDDLGRQRSASTRPTKDHFVSRVSAGILRAQSSIPTSAARGSAVPVTSPPLARPKSGPGSVDVSKWQVQRGEGSVDEPPPSDELSRIYHFSRMKGDHPTATLRIVCTVQASLENGLAGEAANIHRRLRFYLWPFRLPHEASFRMRLLTEDESEEGLFDVLASPLGGDKDTAVIAKFGGKHDVTRCLAALMSGKRMTFMLADDTESLVNFRLPNDGEFKRLYDETCDRLARLNIAYEVVHQNSIPQKQVLPSLTDQVRKDPKSYAVWMLEPNPGDYAVWLVKLDSKGEMADAWGLKSLLTRVEQGAFALDVARDLRVPLMDVVSK